MNMDKEEQSIFIPLMILVVTFFIGFVAGAIVSNCVIKKEITKEITQELCNRQQYDFCVVDKTIYRIK